MTPFRARPGYSGIRIRGWLALARAALWVGFRTTLPTRPARFKPRPRRVRRGARRAWTREVYAERRASARAQKLAARAPMDKDAARLWVWTSMGRARAVVRRPRPRAAQRTHKRASPVAPGRGSAAPPEGPDDQGADDEDDGPPRIAPRPTRSRRGRPRKRRSFRAFTSPKTWRKRLAQAEAVAALPGALFVSLLPHEAPGEVDRRLARVPAQIADRFAALARRLRRERGAYFAIAAATRAERGAFWPHAHAVVVGVRPDRLAVLAARSGLRLAYAEPVRDGRAAVRYALGAHQRSHWDRIEGGRGFWAKVPEAAEATAALVSSRNNLVDTPLGRLPVVPGPVDLGPGVRVLDPLRFLIANAEAAVDPNPRIRGPAIEALAAYANAIGAPLALCGPPRPGAAPGKGGRR